MQVHANARVTVRDDGTAFVAVDVPCVLDVDFVHRGYHPNSPAFAVDADDGFDDDLAAALDMLAAAEQRSIVWGLLVQR